MPDWRQDWLSRLDADPFLAPLWASHQRRDAYWKHGSVCEDWTAIRTPVQIWGGWADNYMNTVSQLVENLSSPVKGIVGPWVHLYAHQAVPGPAIGFLDEALRWWDRWLKDIPNAVDQDPAYRVWMQHSTPPSAVATHRPGHWVSEATWPSPRVTSVALPLSPGRIGGAGGPLSQRISTPQYLGLHAGEFFPMSLNAEMAGDQRHDDALSDCFDRDVLTAPLDLIGAAKLRLRLTSDRPRTSLVARLCDVGPDGASTRIAQGMLNLCHAAGHEAPSALTPGKPIDVTLTLDQMAHRLASGHRLRLALSTTYWPFLWPSPDVATLTLHEASLTLPHHQGSDNEWTPPEPAAGPAWPQRILRPATAARNLDHDLVSGRRRLTILDDSGEIEHLEHGMITGSGCEEVWSITEGDPLLAEVVINCRQTLRRGDWQVRTETWTRLTGTATALKHEARLVAYEGETLVFERGWHVAVPRDLV